VTPPRSIVFVARLQTPWSHVRVDVLQPFTATGGVASSDALNSASEICAFASAAGSGFALPNVTSAVTSFVMSWTALPQASYVKRDPFTRAAPATHCSGVGPVLE